jgi:hypothetical protein
MYLRLAAAVVCISSAIGSLSAQQRVDPRNMYERVIAIVPLIGKGTLEDPKRPMYAPAPSAMSPTARTGIIGYTHVLSDDGKSALVEYVARDRSAFQQILADPTITASVKGKDNPAAIVSAFQKLKKDFDFSTFGVRVP